VIGDWLLVPVSGGILVSGSSPVWLMGRTRWPSPASNILNHKAHEAHKESLLVHSESRTLADLRGRERMGPLASIETPRRSCRTSPSPCGLAPARDRWLDNPSLDGLSAAAPLVALPVPGGQVRQEPLWSL
jgi:hypothetical protein